MCCPYGCPCSGRYLRERPGHISGPGRALAGSAAVGPRGRQAQGRVDQGDVAEGLREVADLALQARVPLLGEEAQVVAERQELLEELAGLVDPADHREVVRHPERAGQERALVAG